jgi:hypothetical protein
MYKPSASGDASRLLHLQPALDLLAQVEGTLEYTTQSKYHHELIDDYIALSYALGDHSDLRTILLDGHEFKSQQLGVGPSPRA